MSLDTVYTTQGPATSKQSTSQTLPRYALRRVNIPGPNTGFPYVVNFGPKTITATTSSQLCIAVPGSNRLMAFGWYCTSTGGASAINVGRVASSGGPLATSIANASIDLVATPSGVIYFNDTTASNYLKKTLLNTGTDLSSATDPEMPQPGVGSPRVFYEARFTAASTVADFQCYFLICPTRHSNVNSGAD